MKFGFVIAIAVALLVGRPAVAAAKPRVAIVELDGDKNSELQDSVAEALEDTFIIVGPRQVSRTIEKLGFDTDLSTKQLKKLSTELDVNVIIRGEVKKRGEHRVLHLRLYKDGKKIRGFRVEFASARSRKFKTALQKKLIERLGVSPAADEPVADETSPASDESQSGDEPTGDESQPAEETAEDVPADLPPPKKPKKKFAKKGDDDEQTDGETDTGPQVATSGHTLNRAAARIEVGPSVSQRNLMFTSRAFEEAPNTYSNSPVPGIRVAGEIYPFAFGNPNGIASGIGIGGDYDRTLSLNVTSTVQPGTTFPVTQSHWSLGPRLRVVFGRKPTSPSLVVKGGYMARDFTVDRSKLMPGNVIDLPDVGYRGFTGGADVRVPVAPSIALFGGIGGIFVTTTGGIQSREQYGQAKVTGVEAAIGVDIGIGKRYLVRIAGDLCQLGYAFTGNGELANNRDGDPSTVDVGGAADRYIGGSALFGVFY